MNKILFSFLLCACINALGQDYLVKRDGTIINGKMKSFNNNVFTITTSDGKDLSYDVTDINKAYIADEHFRMDNISLENATFINNNGLTILLDKSTPHPSHQNQTFSSGSSPSESTSSSSVVHISSDNNAAEKGTLVLNCTSCAQKGKIEFVSRDGKSTSKVSFESDSGKSFFPYRIKLDADRTYDWTYYDKNIGEKSGSIKIEAGGLVKFSLDK